MNFDYKRTDLQNRDYLLKDYGKWDQFRKDPLDPYPLFAILIAPTERFPFSHSLPAPVS